MRNKIIRYRSELRLYARYLRKNMTPSEKKLWIYIRKRKLGVQFHRQVPMLDYVIDFYCHEIGLAIEIDGAIHDHQFLYDAKRQGRLEAEGVTFLRFSNKDINLNIGIVLRDIECQIEELIL